MYTVKISHEQLIDLLQDHYDQNIYENIKDGDMVETVEVSYVDIEIIIGKE